MKSSDTSQRVGLSEIEQHYPTIQNWDVRHGLDHLMRGELLGNLQLNYVAKLSSLSHNFPANQ